jgi:hypothetical protein
VPAWPAAWRRDSGKSRHEAAYDDRRPSIPLLPSLLRPHRHSKPIARPFQTASFKRLYRKRSGARDSLVPETLSCRSVPDTALLTHIAPLKPASRVGCLPSH